jgi:predicted amidohydrolase
VYSKQYLHADEAPFFVRGRDQNGLIVVKDNKIALAICYELSVAAHAEAASKNGAAIYLASVAKTARGVASATERMSEIARKYSMTALMTNCLGLCGGGECAGGSAIWNKSGVLLEQLNDVSEGVLIIDTDMERTAALLA